ncbi:MAG TPA: hypothetical protein VGJ20_11580 [Xanthobacteraceae bacterium]
MFRPVSLLVGLKCFRPQFTGALIWINAEMRRPQCDYGMSQERSHDLAALCTDLVRKGEDFPTVWTTVLKRNALVIGIPESKLEGQRPVLEIRLITGERLLFDGERKKFNVK